jgi:hypothetical protein
MVLVTAGIAVENASDLAGKENFSGRHELHRRVEVPLRRIILARSAKLR